MVSVNSTSKKLVSVIMAAYNVENFIGKAIDSILSQSYQNFELLICDDGSTDNTKSIINSYSDSRIRKYFNDENKGIVYTKNLLFEKATGEYVAFQDADDWSHIKRLETQLNALEEKGVDVVATGGFLVRNNEEEIIENATNNLLINSFGNGNMPFVMASLFFRYSVLTTTGVFAIQFNKLIGEDLYWVSKVLEQYSIYFISKPLYYYRYQVDSITNTFYSEDKLFSIELIIELANQRKKKGFDWIEKNDQDKIECFFNIQKNSNKKLSEKYRIIAAKHIDFKNLKIAKSFLLKSFALNPRSMNNIRTAIYLMRSYFG